MENWLSDLLKVRCHVLGKSRAVTLGITDGCLIFITNFHWKSVYIFKFSLPSCGSLQTFLDLRVVKRVQRLGFPESRETIPLHLRKPFCGQQGNFDSTATMGFWINKVTHSVSGCVTPPVPPQVWWFTRNILKTHTHG